jgi:hypothetical protein
MTALRNEFSQSFSQVHASISAADVRVTAHDNSLLQLHSSVVAADAILAAHGASISAINTTISGMATVISAHNQSLSQLHASIGALSTLLETSYAAFSGPMRRYVYNAGPQLFEGTYFYLSASATLVLVGPPGDASMSRTWTALASVPADARIVEIGMKLTTFSLSQTSIDSVVQIQAGNDFNAPPDGVMYWYEKYHQPVVTGGTVLITNDIYVNEAEIYNRTLKMRVHRNAPVDASARFYIKGFSR